MLPTRRAFLAASTLWTQAVAAAQQHTHAPMGAAAPFTFTFFSPGEVKRLRELAAVLIPADSRSGGAAAARVEEYIDFVLAHAAPPLQQLWRRGLQRTTPAHLPVLARSEFSPKSPDEEFFVQLKAAVVEGFYTSEEGVLRELGYQGLGFVREFPGCTHDSHTAPAGYRPRLRARTS